MNLTRSIIIKLNKLRDKEMCPSFLNIYFRKYSVLHLLNDIFSGIKIFFLLFPVLISLSILSGASPVQGIITGLVAMSVSAFLGGLEYQISSITFPVCLLTLEISARYQYKGLLITALVVFITLYISGRLRLSEVLRHTSDAFLAAITFYVALVTVIVQGQYIMGISSPAPYQSFVSNLYIMVDNIKHVSVSGIYNLLIFVTPLIFLRLFFTEYISYFIYLLICISIIVMNNFDLIKYSEIIATYKTIGQDLFDSFSTNNILNISYSIPSQFVLSSIENFGFAISIIIASQSSFCTNIAASLTGDTRTQANMELISSGIANFISVSCGGLFVSPDINLTIKNIQMKAKSLIPLFIISFLCLITILLNKQIFKYIPMYSISAILVVLALSVIINSNIFKYIFKISSDSYIFFTTLTIALFFGFVPAVFIGFILSLINFAKRLVNIKDASVHSTKNHDSSVIEFVSNKYGYSSNKKIPSKILNKIEVIQINNILFLNLINIVKESLIIRGSFPRVIIIYLKNAPYLDGKALDMLQDFVHECSKQNCLVMVSGTNGVLLDILHKKTTEYNSGNIFGYIIPNFSEAIQQTIKRLKI